MSTDGKGYKLPEVIDPPGDVCIQVTIPDSLEYRAAVWGALTQLTKWYAWQRDELKRGKDAAARFAAALAPSYEAYLEGTTCTAGGAVMLRQNPDHPCQLEQSMDGETWELAFDYELCLGDLPPLYTSTTTGGREPDTATMDDILWWLREELKAIDQALTAGTPLPDIVAARSGVWQAATGLDLTPAITSMVGSWSAATGTERTAAIDSSEWQTYRDGAICPVRRASGGMGDNMYSWLNQASNSISDWLNSTSDALFQALNQAVSLLQGKARALYGIAAASRARGGGGAGFGWDGVECAPPPGQTFHTFNFRAESGGFVEQSGLAYTDPELQYWGMGQGWIMTADPDNGKRSSIVWDMPGEGNVVSVRFLYSAAYEILPGNFTISVWDDGIPQLFDVSGIANGSPSNVTQTVRPEVGKVGQRVEISVAGRDTWVTIHELEIEVYYP